MPELRFATTGPAGSDVIKRFLEHCHRRHCAAKTTIIRQGEPSKELFFIVNGSVTVALEDKKGHEIVLAYLNAGEFFGEIGLFNENVARTALVRARGHCEIASITYEKLRTLSSIFPELVTHIAGQLATRLRRLAFMDVSGRVARAILDLCKEPDAMTHPEGMQIRITRQELGRIVGCSREMVGRVLKALEEQNLLTAPGKTIVVFGVR